MDRRSMLLAAGVAGSVAVLPHMSRATTAKPTLKGPYLDLTTAQGTLINRVRMDGNLDESKEKFGYGSGTVSAVVPGSAIKPLFGFELFSAARIRKQPDGTYRLLHREVVYYSDLKTGEILTEVTNPLTGELVKVVHVVNDPWNEHFTLYREVAPSYGGLIKNTRAPEPFILDWQMLPRGIVSTQETANLYYPATLQPEKWPRESAGKMNQVTEVFTKYALLADIQNPKLTSVEYSGQWTRITPWLPWMLMGQAPGHIMYNCAFANSDTTAKIKPNVLAFTRDHFPQMLHAPMEWSGKSLSSLENYALTQKPQPPK